MNILEHINPKKVFNSLKNCLTELKYNRNFNKIVRELESDGSLEKMGLNLRKNRLYFGVDLNPELLLYGESSQETVEMKFVQEKMLKYTEFLKKEGILDSITADYDRIQNVDYYGYVIEIKFAFREYSFRKLAYNIMYFVMLAAIPAAALVYYNMQNSI